jgi:hypothetical protein
MAMRLCFFESSSTDCLSEGWQKLLIQVCQDEFESFAVRSPANDL